MPVSPALLARTLHRLCCARAGNIATIAALATPAALTLTLGATDVTAIVSDKSRMRSIAESAALAGARNLAVAMTESDALAHARAMAQGIVAEWEGAPTIEIDADTVNLEAGAKGVRVTLAAHRSSFFNDLLPPGGWRYNARATASSVGSSPLCVLSFGAQTGSDFLVRDSGEIHAPDCLVHSNGDIDVRGSGRIEARRTQAVRNATGDISPDPVTDAPEIRDPFADLDIDADVPGCAAAGRGPAAQVYNSGTHQLPAGDHCGAITVSDDAVLELMPGEHRFGAGVLIVQDEARLVGRDVVLIFDKFWRTAFLDEATVSLSGREDGLLAGFVMAADRDNVQRFEIDATHVERLDGVIYIPKAELRISSRGDVANKSDWTVIVAHRLKLFGNPNLFISARYGDSDLTVPQGVGSRRDTVRLVE